MEKLQEAFESAIETYSSSNFLDSIKKAKEEYFELAGKILEDDEDYESRMNGFTYWYLTQRDADEKLLIEEFLRSKEIEDEIAQAILNLNHSLFEYRGKGITGKHKFKDILHNVSFSIASKKFDHSIIKGDLFVARSVELQSEIYLLDDVSLLPKEVKSILVKECKKVRKLNDRTRDLEFLMEVERLKTKWRRYGHVDPKKIFAF